MISRVLYTNSVAIIIVRVIKCTTDVVRNEFQELIVGFFEVRPEGLVRVLRGVADALLHVCERLLLRGREAVLGAARFVLDADARWPRWARVPRLPPVKICVATPPGKARVGRPSWWPVCRAEALVLVEGECGER